MASQNVDLYYNIDDPNKKYSKPTGNYNVDFTPVTNTIPNTNVTPNTNDNSRNPTSTNRSRSNNYRSSRNNTSADISIPSQDANTSITSIPPARTPSVRSVDYVKEDTQTIDNKQYLVSTGTGVNYVGSNVWDAGFNYTQPKTNTSSSSNSSGAVMSAYKPFTPSEQSFVDKANKDQFFLNFGLELPNDSAVAKTKNIVFGYANNLLPDTPAPKENKVNLLTGFGNNTDSTMSYRLTKPEEMPPLQAFETNTNKEIFKTTTDIYFKELQFEDAIASGNISGVNANYQFNNYANTKIKDVNNFIIGSRKKLSEDVVLYNAPYTFASGFTFGLVGALAPPLAYTIGGIGLLKAGANYDKIMASYAVSPKAFGINLGAGIAGGIAGGAVGNFAKLKYNEYQTNKELEKLYIKNIGYQYKNEDGYTIDSQSLPFTFNGKEYTITSSNDLFIDGKNVFGSGRGYLQSGSDTTKYLTQYNFLVDDGGSFSVNDFTFGTDRRFAGVTSSSRISTITSSTLNFEDVSSISYADPNLNVNWIGGIAKDINADKYITFSGDYGASIKPNIFSFNTVVSDIGSSIDDTASSFNFVSFAKDLGSQTKTTTSNLPSIITQIQTSNIINDLVKSAVTQDFTKSITASSLSIPTTSLFTGLGTYERTSETISLLRIDTSQNYKLGTQTGVASLLINKVDVSTPPIFVTGTSNRVGTNTLNSFGTALQEVSLATAQQSFRTSLRSTDFNFGLGATTSKIFTADFPNFNFDIGGKIRKQKYKKRTKYTPDFPSMIFNIKGKAPKTELGQLRNRPIPRGFTYSYNKIKPIKFNF